MAFDVVYLARHGQTAWNLQGRKQGQLDSPLTEAGRNHAQALARLAGTFNADLVASSPIGRARTTAQVCADALELAVTVVDELAEVHHGKMAGLTSAEADARFPGALEQRRLAKYRWRFPCGESYADADERAAVALERILQTGARRPLIVSHEMIGRMLLRNLIASPPAVVLSTQQPHDLVYLVDPSTREVREVSTQRLA